MAPIPRVGLVALFVVFGLPPEVMAQPVATIRWQLQPYCNIVTLHVTQQGDVFILEGSDDQCGVGTQHAGVVGAGFLNPDGSIGIGLTTVLRPGGAPVHVDARINVASLSGPWRDSVGNSGGFVFTPAGGIGGVPRPGNSNGVKLASITIDQLNQEVLDKLPPEVFSFDESGSLIVTDVDFNAPPPTPFPLFAWVPQVGILRAGFFTFGSAGGGTGALSWAGGLNSVASATASFAFGEGPMARGRGAIALGERNGACGENSVALGADAHTSDAPTADDPCGGTTTYSNAFVFSDGSAPTVAQDRQFVAAATGGFHFYTSASGPTGNKCILNPGGGTWACSSDRALKERFAPLNGEEVLRKLAGIPVDAWSFIAEPGARHVGPTAQDFHAAFGLGTDDTLIGYTDINGINMRAIQALEVRTRELGDSQLRLQRALDLVEAQAAEMAALKTRLTEIEGRLGTLVKR